MPNKIKTDKESGANSADANMAADKDLPADDSQQSTCSGLSRHRPSPRGRSLTPRRRSRRWRSPGLICMTASHLFSWFTSSSLASWSRPTSKPTWPKSTWTKTLSCR
ncbi:uncharacterized protein LOC144001003 isoform X2 [Festucalex cinctus]